MYASTKGMRIDTQLITVSVNCDEELLAMVSDDSGSVSYTHLTLPTIYSV